MHTFTTTAGKVVPIQPISLLDLQLAQNAVLQEFKERGEPVDVPTYDEIVMEGEPEETRNPQPYTEASIKDAPEEDKEKWRLHLDAVERLNEATLKRTGLILLEGMNLDGLYPETDDWVKKRKKLFNQDVPEDEDERKLFWVNNVLCKTPHDREIQLEIQKLSMTGADEEAISAYEDLFRGEMENAQRPYIAQLREQVRQQVESQTTEENLDVQPDSEGRDNGEGSGPNPKRVSVKVRPRSSSGNSD